MATKRLTDGVIKTLKATDRAFTITDMEANGLSLVVTKASRIWRYRYSYAGKQRSPIKIGEWPAVDVTTARAKALDYEKVRLEGRDPRHMVVVPRLVPTVRDIVEYHMSTLAGETHRNAKSSYKDLLAAHGDTRVSDFSRPMLVKWLAENYPKRPGACRLLLRNLRSAFNKAADQESGLKLPAGFASPTVGAKAKLPFLAEKPPGSYAKSYEAADLKAMLAGIDAAYADGLWPMGVAVIELALLTGARSGELKALKWDQIEERPGQPTRIVLDRHKTWRKTGRPRQILVVGEAAKVIARVRGLHARHKLKSDYVFPQRRKQANQKVQYVAQLGHYTDRIGKLAGIDFIPHNCRSAYINHALDTLGLGWLDIVAENVGHTDTRTTMSFYRKLKDSKMVEAAKTADEAFAALRAG